jgi:cyclase
MEIQKIAPDAFVVIGDAYDSNTTILINDAQALLIETMAIKKDALEMKQFVERELLKEVRFIISTHYFSDHLAGLNLFRGAEIIAHKNYAHTFDSERYRSQEEKENFAEPTILISDGMELRWGRFHLHLFYNPGHTMSTLNVDIPEIETIHVGDTLVGNMVYLSYSSPSMIFGALNEILRRRRRNLISSHLGFRSGKAADHGLHYLKSLQKQSIAAWQSGSAESILKTELDSCLPEKISGTPFEKIFHKRNLQSIVDRQLFS